MQGVIQLSPKHTGTLIDRQGWSPQIFHPRLSREWEILAITLQGCIEWKCGRWGNMRRVNQFLPKLKGTLICPQWNSSQIFIPCTLTVLALHLITFIINFFLNPNPHSSVKNWTKWVLILTKFDVHHGLPATTHHKFSTLVPLSFLRCVLFVINFSVVFF